MRKLWLLVCGAFLSWHVNALEVSGVKLDEKIQLDKQELVLNGAGVRTKVVFDIYVAALYLKEKSKKADVVLADAGSKRVSMHILFGLKSDTLMEAFKNAFEANHSATELSALDTQLKKFYAIFGTIPEVKKGDVILLDYLPATGTKVTVNGIERGIVEGAEFNRALLKIWLGTRPVQDDLKKDLLNSW